MAWMLLEEKDRQNQIEGGVSACVVLSAMCSEIKISSLLKQRGKVYTDFISAYTKGKKDAGEDNVYHESASGRHDVAQVRPGGSVSSRMTLVIWFGRVVVAVAIQSVRVLGSIRVSKRVCLEGVGEWYERRFYEPWMSTRELKPIMHKHRIPGTFFD